MANFLSTLFEQLKGASAVSKVIAGLVAVATVAIVATFGIVARQPHYRILFSGLDDAQSARVARALADAEMPFEMSQPPGPFVIYTDESDRVPALQVVASSGALEHAPGGILAGENGMSTVFMSASERAQVVLKREWQEVEQLLEGLDFVVSAKVQTSASRENPFGKEVPRTGSVTLEVAGGRRITREQARTVADLVRFALRVAPENLVIADQSGNSVHTGDDIDGFGGGRDWLEQKLRYDAHMSEKASLLLADVLGPGKARVTIDSLWDTDLSAQVSESSDPAKRVVTSESSTSSKTPQFPPFAGGSSVGGPAGTSSNIAIPGTEDLDPTAPTTPAPAPIEPATAQTKQDKKDYFAPVQMTQTVRTAPVLRRLSVSVFLDESLGERAQNLTSSVKTAVGFDAERGDLFSVTTLPFAVAPETEAAAEEPSPLVSPLVETLLRRGVEILSAIVFLFVFFKGIRAAREIAARKPQQQEAPSEAVVEMLARAQVEELINKQPERVGQILSAWARDEDLVGSSK